MRYTCFFFLLLVSTAVFAQDADSLHRLFEEVEQIDDSLSAPGFGGQHPDTFPYTTEAQMVAKAEAFRERVRAIEAIPNEGLDRQDQISRDIMLRRLQDQISRVRFRQYLMPFNAEGGFFTRPVFFLPRLPFDSPEDYEAYLGWLPTYADFLAYNQSLLRQGIELNVMRPEVIVQNAITQLESWIDDDPLKHPFFQPFSTFPPSVDAAEKDRLIARGRSVIEASILPAYRNLYTFFKEEYLPACPKEAGISQITDGRAYYEDRIRFFTTLDITPDSVYAIGLKEVQRIEALMEAIIKEVEFEGDMADFIHFLRTDPKFYAETPEELLSRAAWLSKKAEGALPPLFAKLYELPFTVEPVPDAIAPTYTGGRYVQGSRQADRAGIYWVNTYDLPSRPFYTLPALTLHEAVPGHHLGIMMAAELDSLPRFRRNAYINAYGEGWGLYAEYLGEEMGMYTTPYEWFGRYTYEMWRACRLVVDVGLHYKGWTRQQAVDYLASHTALSMQEVNTEIDRYIGWPGQAVSYKIGELTIKQLRKEAEDALGGEFSIQEFHDVVLRSGAVPMQVLREEVEQYVQAKAVP